MTSFLKIYGSLHGESWWTSCNSFSCRACCSFLAVSMECKEPRVSRPMGCCRTKNARSYSHVHTFGAGCFQIAHETKRYTHTHPQHQSSFSTGTCLVQDLIHALAFDIQAKESAALARYAYVSWDAPWCSHLFCHGTSLVLFILVLTSSPLLCGIL